MEADEHGITINELALAFVKHAAGHYKPNETGVCAELENIKPAIKLLRRPFGHALAKEFGPKKLKITRNMMIAENWWGRVCNRQVNPIRRMFNWAIQEELIPPPIYHGLQAVEPLRRSVTGLRDNPDAKPVRGMGHPSSLDGLRRQRQESGRFSMSRVATVPGLPRTIRSWS
jgi:hypothetical protein